MTRVQNVRGSLSGSSRLFWSRSVVADYHGSRSGNRIGQGEVVGQVSGQSHAWAQSFQQRLWYQLGELICYLLLTRNPIEAERAEADLFAEEVGTDVDCAGRIQVMLSGRLLDT